MEVKLDPNELLFPDKLFGVKSEKNLAEFCLVCLSKVDPSITPKQSDLLSNNLNVIFLLKNVLQVPNDLLIDNFIKCGCPGNWISLCENCSQLTSQAMGHHLQILILVNQLRSILKTFTDKVNESSLQSERFKSYQNDMDDKEKSMEEKRLHILQRTREFVINYDYNTHLVNPFIEGDKLAREFVTREDNHSLSDGSGEEEDFESAVADDWHEDEDDWDVKKETDDISLADDSGEEDVESAVEGDDWQEEKNDDDEQVVEIKEHLVLGIPFSKLPKSRQVFLMGGKWKCEQCDKEFRSSTALAKHKLEKHPAIPGQFKCDICGKRMNSKGYLRSHLIKTHKVWATGNRKEAKGELPESGEDKFGQGNEVADPGACLTDKPVMFQFEKKWKCKHCGRGFMKKRSLKTHEQEKCPLAPGQFVCDICGSTWDTKRLLWSHQYKVHRINKTGKPAKTKLRKPRIKPVDKLTCELCGRSFTAIYSLRKHVKCFHEKQFDIHCHVCGLGVCSDHRLKVHLIMKHKDDPETLKLIEEGAGTWKCEVKGCRGTFWKEKRLDEHRRKVHGDGT